jgi:hypothetical protein
MTMTSIDNTLREPAGISFVTEIVGDNVRLGIDVRPISSEGAMLGVASKISVGTLLLSSPGIVVGSPGGVVSGGRLVDGTVEGETLSGDGMEGADDMLISII